MQTAAEVAPLRDGIDAQRANSPKAMGPEIANIAVSARPGAAGLAVIQRSATSSSDQGNARDIVLPRVPGNMNATRCERGHDIAGFRDGAPAIPPGSRVGRFEIGPLLGAGGMGQIYRATDPRLQRTVAIKVLPPAAASDPERLRGLEREARAASALSHPNIVTVHEVGESDSTPYIVTELVEGETLRDILAWGPLPTKRLLDIAVQIAEGLAAAHDAGIIHRDLTPANVMVTPESVVKILDFGLAKIEAPTCGPCDPETVTFADSTARAGEVVGTAGYMSPEQTRGLDIDFRSDQFSFGIMLYEMATGRRAFSRATAIETLCAVLRDEPEPVDRVQSGVPPPLRWIIERCLAKAPEQRYPSTRDLALELRDLRRSLVETPEPPRTRIDSVLVALVALSATCLMLLGDRASERRRR
jgi:serine/threonine protein kinase